MQVVQTLLQLPQLRAEGRTNVTVAAGVGFSAWLDMTGSSTTYDSLQVGAFPGRVICLLAPAGAAPINR
jgi:hypothetical protein